MLEEIICKKGAEKQVLEHIKAYFEDRFFPEPEITKKGNKFLVEVSVGQEGLETILGLKIPWLLELHNTKEEELEKQ